MEHVPLERSPSPEAGENQYATLQTVCLEEDEEDWAGICSQMTALPQEGTALAALPCPAVLHEVLAGLSESVQEDAFGFDDLWLTQINGLQEEGQAESPESKPTEETPDVHQMKIDRDNDDIVLENKVQQLTPSEERGGKELFSTHGVTKSQSSKASDGLSDSCSEGKEQESATPSAQTVVRNPENLTFQINPPLQKKEEKAAFSCDSCTLTPLRLSSLTHHVNTHSDEKSHVCHLCLKAFRTATLLSDHLNVHTGTRPHKCSDCGMAYGTRGELARHRRYKHTSEKRFKCSVCKYSSADASKMTRHARSHTGERPYACDHCSYASSDASRLKRHVLTHSGEKPYECDVCHSKFKQRGTMKIHMLQKHGDNVPKYQCPHCSTFIMRKSDLSVHLRNLHSYLPVAITCRYCEAGFHERYAFIQHKQTHRNEKRFKCDRCSYVCKQARCLLEHKRIHSGEKPFTCSHCSSRSFRWKGDLTAHFRKHHDSNINPTIYECPKCGKGYTLRTNMHEHAENCGLVRPETAAPRRRSKTKTQKNPKRVKQEVDPESFRDASTVKSELCVTEIVPVSD